ncbi:ferredoxin reductase-like protein [Atractiella rhizophila]|nr:ferredoxin reductase-like protein [Atractiella rhizophila]
MTAEEGPGAVAQIISLVLGMSITSLFLWWYNRKSEVPPSLSSTEWLKYPLQKIITISPNTAIYRFALKKDTSVLGLPIGQHIQIRGKIGGKDIMRSYTPISSDDDKGYVDFMIKSYPQGNISKYVSQLKVGEYVEMKGPKGPKGQMKYVPGYANEIGMIAGGTGITPMLQIIRAILKNPKDKTKVSLIYANVNSEDILLKQDLDNLVETHPERFNVYYVLNNPPEKWEGGVGFVSRTMIEKHISSPSTEGVKVLLCGPPPMMSAMKKHLEDIGFPKAKTISKMEDQVFVF